MDRLVAGGWCRDASVEVAHELRQRCDLQLRDIPLFPQDFVDRYEGRYRDVQLPLPMRLFQRRRTARRRYVSATQARCVPFQRRVNGWFRTGS